MFSSAFKINLVVTATALISLVWGRPQDRRLQPRDWTDAFKLNLDGNQNAFTVPSPSDFVPSSPGSSPPLINLPNLGSITPGTLSAVPPSPERNDPFSQTPETNFPSPAVLIDWTKTLSPSVNGAFDVATSWPPGQLPPDVEPSTSANPDPGEHLVLETEAVKRSIKLISDGDFVYAFFGLSADWKYLVPTLLSNNQEWGIFIKDVRKAIPSYAIHLTPKGMLLIFTHINSRKDAVDMRSSFLHDNFRQFQQLVEETSEKIADANEVYDEPSLYNAVTPYQSY